MKLDQGVPTEPGRSEVGGAGGSEGVRGVSAFITLADGQMECPNERAEYKRY